MIFMGYLQNWNTSIAGVGNNAGETLLGYTRTDQ